MPGFFFRAGLVEPAARQEGGVDGIVPGAAGRCGGRGFGRGLRRRRDGCRRWRRRSSRAAVEFLIKLLEHAGGLLASRHAQIQPLLGFGKQRVRVVFAVVAALAAILLRHRRHQPARQLFALGELHTVRQRHRRIVPRRIVSSRPVIDVGALPGSNRRGYAAIKQTGQQLCSVGARHRRDGFGQAKQAGEQAIEPSPLLRRKWRRFGNQ
jgi:hypothetical protein